MNQSRNDAARSVTPPLTALLVNQTGPSIPVESRLAYRSRDPFAVTMTFWMFSGAIRAVVPMPGHGACPILG